jgi:hypothetical protein
MVRAKEVHFQGLLLVIMNGRWHGRCVQVPPCSARIPRLDRCRDLNIIRIVSQPGQRTNNAVGELGIEPLDARYEKTKRQYTVADRGVSIVGNRDYPRSLTLDF